MYGTRAASRASRMPRRTELTWDSDTVEFPHEMRAALGVGKLGVLPADSLEGDATKRFAHVTGNAKSGGRSHSAMGFGLNAGGFWRRVEHGEGVAGMAGLRSKWSCLGGRYSDSYSYRAPRRRMCRTNAA